MQYVKAYILGGMNKLMNKRQILILSVLSILTATLALCMWAAGLFDTAVPAGGSEAPVWETVREARPSLNENIVWENRLGGTGEESLVAAFTYADRILVFGNTDSTDYDFSAGQGLRGFIAVLDEAGTTQTFYETDRITAVTLHEQGFLLALYAPARLRLIDFSLATVSETPLYSTQDERVLDIFPREDGYTVVTAINETDSGADSLRVVEFDGAFRKLSSRLLARSAKIRYIDAFVYADKTVVAVNFDFGAVQCMSLIELAGGNPLYYDITAEGGYFACDVMPYGGGYAALILSDGSADILTVNANYTAAKRIYLNSAECTSGRLYAAGDRIYAYVHKEGDLSQLCELNANLDYIGIVPEANTFTAAHAYFMQGNYCNILCSAPGRTLVVSLGDEKRITSLRVETTACLWLKTPSAVLIVAEAQAGEDCSGQIGGTDIAVLRLA